MGRRQRRCCPEDDGTEEKKLPNGFSNKHDPDDARAARDAVVSAIEQSIEHTLDVWNLPNQAKPDDVVRFVDKLIGCSSELVRCKISIVERRTTGEATLIFQTATSFKACWKLLKQGVRFDTRVVYCREHQPHFKNSKRSDRIDVFQLNSISLLGGEAFIPSSPAVVRWRSSNKVSLRMNAMHTHQMVIEFDERHRIQVALTTIKECYLPRGKKSGPDRGKQRSIQFRVDQAPHLFTRKASSRLKGPHGVDDIGSGDESEWERALDPCDGAWFGHCLLYDLLMDGGVHLALLHYLSAYSLHPIQLNDVVPVSIGTDVLTPCRTNWTGGYDDVFHHVPFEVAYILHSAIANDKLHLRRRSDAETLCKMVMDAAIPQHKIVEVLEDCFLEHKHGHDDGFGVLVETLRAAAKTVPPMMDRIEPDARVQTYTRTVLITPLRIVPLPIDLDNTNRVLRLFEEHRDRFIRVAFCDEDFASVKDAVQSSKPIEERVRRLLQEGIVIAGRRFVFLAYSMSQFRVQSCWMYDEERRRDDREPHTIPTASSIRTSIGDLSKIDVVGKYGARLGQAFSSTTSTLSITDRRRVHIGDVQRNGFVFSDGVGVISPELAQQLAIALKLKRTPSAFQIRYGGCKGVVGVLPTGCNAQPKADLLIRPSMDKFRANEDHNDVEICSHSKAMLCYINRQIITVLSANGVPDRVFMQHAQRVIDQLNSAMSDHDSCRAFVGAHASRSVADRMLSVGMRVDDDRHLWEMVRSLRDRCLLDLQTKARMMIPNAVCLIGIMDETDTLEPDQVFFQRSEPALNVPAGTRVAVGRSPCLHPGDIRVMATTDCPALSNLFDVIVFSQKGDRPRPNMMSGGDLDGDIYFVFWESSLVPKRSHDPMTYEPAAAPVRPRTDVDITHLEKFFVDYIVNDNLGRIAKAHVAFADRSPDGARSAECIELAALHSTAVDFAKTGIAAVLPAHLIPKAYPKFMENLDQEWYTSTNVLGDIHRLASGAELDTSPPPLARINDRFLIEGHERFVDEAERLYVGYCWDMYDIASRCQVSGEYEMSGSKRIFNDQYQNMLVSAVRRKYRDAFLAGLDDAMALCKASAWYRVAYSTGAGDGTAQYLGFAWVNTDQMCALVRKVTTCA